MLLLLPLLLSNRPAIGLSIAGVSEQWVLVAAANTNQRRFCCRAVVVVVCSFGSIETAAATTKTTTTTVPATTTAAATTTMYASNNNNSPLLLPLHGQLLYARTLLYDRMCAYVICMVLSLAHSARYIAPSQSHIEPLPLREFEL